MIPAGGHGGDQEPRLQLGPSLAEAVPCPFHADDARIAGPHRSPVWLISTSRHLAARCQVSRTLDLGRCTIASAHHVGRFPSWDPARPGPRGGGASPRRLASRPASAGPPLAYCAVHWRIRAWPAPDDNHRDIAANEQDTKERHTMWPAKYSVSIRTLRADALFVSALQRSDEPSAEQVQQAITAAVRAFGRAGCAERVAQEFGDHSETAVIRMRWARAVTHEAFTETAPDPDPRPDADPLLVVGPRLPAGETSDSPGRAA